MDRVYQGRKDTCDRCHCFVYRPMPTEQAIWEERFHRTGCVFQNSWCCSETWSFDNCRDFCIYSPHHHHPVPFRRLLHGYVFQFHSAYVLSSTADFCLFFLFRPSSPILNSSARHSQLSITYFFCCCCFGYHIEVGLLAEIEGGIHPAFSLYPVQFSSLCCSCGYQDPQYSVFCGQEGPLVLFSPTKKLAGSHP